MPGKPTSNPGYMLHDCEQRGCWRQRYAVNDWRQLARGLPRNIIPTDIDGAVEVNGKYLLIEFKEGDKGMHTGQRLFFERLPREFTVFYVTAASMNPMRPTSRHTWSRGKWTPRIDGPGKACDAGQLEEAISSWGAWAESGGRG